jgi:hypothetical protein
MTADDTTETDFAALLHEVYTAPVNISEATKEAWRRVMEDTDLAYLSEPTGPPHLDPYAPAWLTPP